MFFVLLTGLAEVYVPKSNAKLDFDLKLEREGQTGLLLHSPPRPSPDDGNWDVITITPGAQQVLIATDTDGRARGHLTFYPSDVETVALQIPFRGTGMGPEGEVAHEGPCLGNEE
jgi:hypothetical protein